MAAVEHIRLNLGAGEYSQQPEVNPVLMPLLLPDTHAYMNSVLPGFLRQGISKRTICHPQLNQVTGSAAAPSEFARALFYHQTALLHFLHFNFFFPRLLPPAPSRIFKSLLLSMPFGRDAPDNQCNVCFY